jgi:Mn2+/Fe2+ NRAMP family transporter
MPASYKQSLWILQNSLLTNPDLHHGLLGLCRTAVINGLLAPFLLVAFLVIVSDEKLMQGQPSSRLGWSVVAITTVAMFVAGVAMFVV